MIIELIIDIFFYFTALVGIVGTLARPQDQEGYNYEVPENPLVIQRPTEDPVEPPPPAADDYVEYDESQAGESLPDSQDGGHEGGGGHHGHGDDPLDWLRASVPGKNTIINKKK